MKLPAFLLCVLAASPAFAQNSPPNGYWKLVKASQLRVPGPTGSISSGLFFPPAENLRRERLVVKRDAPALKLMRQALKMPISVPDSVDDFGRDYLTSPAFTLGRIHELGRLIIHESDVRFANGDYSGAIDSRLDCMQMGVKVSNGCLRPMFRGWGIESMGADNFERFASQLNANQCLQAIYRLKEIAAQRPTFAHIMRLEGQHSYGLSLRDLKSIQNNPQSLKKGIFTGEFSWRDAAEISILKSDTIKKNNSRLFDAVLLAAKLPFQKARKAIFPKDLDYFNRWSLSIVEDSNLRVLYERQVAQNRLLQCAFELRAIKLKTGVYPVNFKTPVNPFSIDLKPMVYRRSDKCYKLYSVGPDSKDNGGYTPTYIRETIDPNTGRKIKVKSKMKLLSGQIGDLTAPIFQ